MKERELSVRGAVSMDQVIRLRSFWMGCGILAAMEPAETGSRGAADLLVERARRGDAAAFEELVRRHLPQVWRVVWRILRHHEDTEDVVQEVFLAAHKALASYRGEALFSTWLHRIAVNRALNHRSLAAEKLRRASSPLDAGTETDPPDAPVFSPTPLRDLEMKELTRRLKECLEKLPAPWRAVFALRAGESLSYEEIAGILGTAIGTVRSRLARARLALRDCVEGEPG